MNGTYAKASSLVRLLVGWCVAVMIFSTVGAEQPVELKDQVIVSSTVVPVVDYTDTTPRQIESRELSVKLQGWLGCWSNHGDNIAVSRSGPTRERLVHGLAPNLITLVLLGTLLRL
jgi:hypothetical protein